MANKFEGLVTTDPVINAETRFPIVIAISATFASLSFAAVVLRLYTRVFLIHQPGIDDATIALAEVLALVVSLGAGMEARHGLGRHSWTVSAEDVLIQAKWLYVVVIFYSLTTNVIKISFLFQYRRLFPERWTLTVCKWSLVFVTVWTVTQVTLKALACIPLSTLIPSMADRCIPTDPIWYMESVGNVVMDFAIFLIPLRPIIRLSIVQRKQKIILLAIFSLGFFVCIISIIRIFYLSQRTRSRDTYWTSVSTACWSIVEIHCGILCSCLPTLRPVLRRVFPSLAESTTEAKSYELRNSSRGFSKRVGGSGTNNYKPQVRLTSSSSVEGLTGHAASVSPVSHIHVGQQAKISSKIQSTESDTLGFDDSQQTKSGREGLQIFKHQTFETNVSIRTKTDLHHAR